MVLLTRRYFLLIHVGNGCDTLLVLCFSRVDGPLLSIHASLMTHNALVPNKNLDRSDKIYAL